MSSARERFTENPTVITSIVVLTTLFVAVFLGLDPVIPVIAVFGFAVVVPLVAILTGGDDETNHDEAGHDHESHQPTRHSGDHDRTTTDALATLRERYARGDLSDIQFERKLDALLETETPEHAAEWRTRKRIADHDGDSNPERTRDRDPLREHERT